MSKKYQIFISSTYDDLKDEREQVIKAILEMGHIPVGMEMFSAGDETQWQLIKKTIDDCDYYVVLTAHRYGSMDGDVSYTEKEYNYAVEKEIPILAFIINEETKWQKRYIDTDQSKINKFKDKLKTKIVDFWQDSKDLKSKVSIALIKQMAINPRPGWVKSTNVSDPEVLNEISRLSKENASLRDDLSKEQNINNQEMKKIQNKEHILTILEKNNATIEFKYQNSIKWENKTSFTYLGIFDLLTSQLQVWKSTHYICSYVGLLLDPQKERKLVNDYPTPTNTIKDILTDFSVLNLIEVKENGKNVNEQESELWKVTKFGQEMYSFVRLKLLESRVK